jgi:hypothetical protein
MKAVSLLGRFDEKTVLDPLERSDTADGIRLARACGHKRDQGVGGQGSSAVFSTVSAMGNAVDRVRVEP